MSFAKTAEIAVPTAKTFSGSEPALTPEKDFFEYFGFPLESMPF